MRIRVGVVALLLLVAGCQAPAADPGTATGPSQDGQPPTGPADSETTPARNPWGAETVTVAVSNEASPWRNVTPPVADALDYWNRHAREYGRYRVGFELEPDAADPDVVVRYVGSIGACGSVGYEDGAGFAPRITADDPPEPPEYVCVRRGFDDGSTRHILKHEFGHVLGIDHDEPPRELMRADRQYRRIPNPEPVVRSAAFPRRNVTVAVDRSTVHARRDVVAQRQLDAAIAYYDRGDAETVDDDVSVTETDDEGRADVVVTFPRRSACDVDVGSCGTVVERPDGDRQLRVEITATHEDTFGWHAGYWLAYAVAAERHGDLPPTFRNASFASQRSQWWNAGS